jgi:hypothetical protein
MVSSRLSRMPFQRRRGQVADQKKRGGADFLATLSPPLKRKATNSGDFAVEAVPEEGPVGPWRRGSHPCERCVTFDPEIVIIFGTSGHT